MASSILGWFLHDKLERFSWKISSRHSTISGNGGAHNMEDILGVESHI